MIVSVAALTMALLGSHPAPPAAAGATLGGVAAFGRALAIAGRDVFVGEPAASGAGGRVYIYRKQGGAWGEVASLAASDATAEDGFGSTIAGSGGVVVVSAGRGNQNRGSAYIFENDGGRWKEVARLTASESTPAENFGAALTTDGDLVLVGAPTQNLQTGAVYVYRRQGTRWLEEARLLSPQPKEQQFFGQAVALQGDRILVGEPGQNQRAGVVHVFAKTNGAWRAAGSLAPATVQPGDRFGAALAVDGDVVHAGAPGFSGGAGAVFTFARQAGGVFQEQAQRRAPDARAGEQFGGAIAAASGYLWIGSPRADGARGAVYHFSARSTTPRRFVAADLAPSDFFGSAVAAQRGLAVLAAPNDDFGLGSITIVELVNGEWRAAAPIGRPDQRMASHAGRQIDCSGGKAGEFGCANVDLLSFMSVQDLGGGRGAQLSGIWGWTDPQTKHEYALVGRVDGTAFVDVTDPTRPRYLGDLPLTPGANPSWWREIKTYQNYMLVSADGAGAHGVQIFDLTQLRDRKQPRHFDATVVYRRVNSVHNIVVNEESGFAYAVGSSSGGETCGGGLHMIDMRDPLNPQFAGCFADPQTGRASTGYTHDALCVIYRGPDRDYQDREICLGANETMLSIADVTDKKAPRVIARGAYPRVGYLHQGWFTSDSRYFFMNDELDEVSGLVQNTRTLIWDLADLDDPQMVREFSSPTRASDHNLYIKGDRMYQSHYRAGVRLVDISNPLAPVEIGYFDTAPTEPDEPGFDGSWGNYPYFESGTWIASSVKEGLFILKPKDHKPVL